MRRQFLIWLIGPWLIAACAQQPEDTPAADSLPRAEPPVAKAADPVPKGECLEGPAPLISDFGPSGVAPVYHFLVDGASDEEFNEFLTRTKALSLDIMPSMMNIEGKDVVFATGLRRLVDQHAVDTDFLNVCATAIEPIRLVYVRYNLGQMNGGGYVRVR